MQPSKKKNKVCFIKKNYFNQMDEINLLKKYGPIISNDERHVSLDTAVKKNFK